MLMSKRSSGTLLSRSDYSTFYNLLVRLRGYIRVI